MQDELHHARSLGLSVALGGAMGAAIGAATGHVGIWVAAVLRFTSRSRWLAPWGTNEDVKNQMAINANADLGSRPLLGSANDQRRTTRFY